MQLIDTHTHIYDSAFAADLAAVVERAVGAGCRDRTRVI